MTIDLRYFMRRVPQCVTVVTTFYNGKPHGMTVSSFTSVSLTPPLVIIALEKGTRTCDAVLRSKTFVVNLLSQRQSDVSETFAYLDHWERFDKVRYRVEEDRYPILEDVIGVLYCDVENVYGAGDHMLIVGRVKNIKIFSDKLPLVYLQRKYYTVKPVKEQA